MDYECENCGYGDDCECFCENCGAEEGYCDCDLCYFCDVYDCQIDHIIPDNRPVIIVCPNCEKVPADCTC